MKQSNRGKQNTLMTQRRTVMQSFGIFVAAVTVLFSGALTPAFAASSNSVGGAGNGLKVSPVRSELTVNPGQSVVEDVYVQNVTSQTATFQVVINDFTASSDESGDPALILDSGQSAPSHSLRQYIAPLDNITLKPNEQKDVKVTISIPKNAAAGGYFGAVRFVPATGAGQQNVTISASVASLLLVKVPGNIVDQLSIASFDAREKDRTRTIFTSSKSIDAVVRFQNEGNVQEQPFGKINVKNIRDKVISSIEVNNAQPRSNVLPDSIRKFTIPLKNVGSFGRYTIEGNFGYGTNGQLLTAKYTFYVVPIPLIVIGLLILVIIIVAAFEIPRMVKRYRRAVRRGGRY